MDVLVAGATGRLGGPLAGSLIDRGHRVRALTRDPGSAAAGRLRRRGAHIVLGDLDDPPSLHRAAAGADAVFVLSTPHHGPGPAAEARQAISLADAAVAVIAPAYFMDNLDYPWNRAVLKAGQWPIPLPPDRTVQLIPAIDMARFAALVIEQPVAFAGRRIELASDEVTGPQAARILSGILRRPLAHQQKVPGPLAPMAPFFQWIAGTGFHADIQQLRTGYPEICWQSLRQWAAA